MDSARVERRGGGFEARIVIRASRDRVFSELSSPTRHLGLQPLLVEVNPWADGHGFEAIEQVPILGRWGFRNRIQVAVDPASSGDTVGFHARASGVQVHSEFQLTPDAAEIAATRVVERFRVEIPAWLRPLRGFIEGRAVMAQGRLLENLRDRLERSGGGP